MGRQVVELLSVTDITSPIHSRADVDLVDRLRAAVSLSRGLVPSDYGHFIDPKNKRPDQRQPVEPLRGNQAVHN